MPLNTVLQRPRIEDRLTLTHTHTLTHAHTHFRACRFISTISHVNARLMYWRASLSHIYTQSTHSLTRKHRWKVLKRHTHTHMWMEYYCYEWVDETLSLSVSLTHTHTYSCTRLARLEQTCVCCPKNPSLMPIIFQNVFFYSKLRENCFVMQVITIGQLIYLK